MEHTVLFAKNIRYKGNMARKSQKKSEQVLVMLVPETFNELKSIATAEDRPLGYVARELMIRGLNLYAQDGYLKDNNSARNIVHNAIQKAIPAHPPQDLGNADDFSLEDALDRYNDPHHIMTEWFAAEGRQLPADYGVVFFQGWETFTREERLDAVRDAKKVLDRTMKAQPKKPAEVRPFRVPDDAPLKQDIQRALDEFPISETKPRKRRSK